MLNTIKICFSLYSNNLKSVTKDNTEYDVDNMTIDEIESAIDILHMKYILTSLYSISATSIQIMAHTHMKNMIEKYNNNTCRFLGNNMTDIESVQFTNEMNEPVVNECEQVSVPLPVPEQTQGVHQNVTKKGWIF